MPEPMSVSRLTVLRHGFNHWDISGVETTTTVDRLKDWLRRGAFVPHLFKYGEARLLTHRVESIGRPFKLGLLMRVLSRGPCYVEDERGHRRLLSMGLLARWGWQSLWEPVQKGPLLARIGREVDALERRLAAGRRPGLDLRASPVYLRADMGVGIKAGGSVGHIAGVLNHLPEFTGPPVMLTTDVVPTVDRAIEVHCVTPMEAFWEYPELPSFMMNRAFDRELPAIEDCKIAFVYERYSLNSFSGVRLAASRDVPFVLEYNGSEIWMSRHWGNPLENEALSQRIEMLNLAAADLIVVVSRAMEDGLVAQGVPRDKILMNPNGVEPDRYSPDIDGAPVRTRLGLDGKTVVGFIGTFGHWHGAEVLAEAFGRLMARRLDLRAGVRLLMIGDGARMPEVREVIARHGIEDVTVLTGLVPQAEGPQYLAACDILASPHVPNPDGTPFFGSPTKLFEYMAMGKPIVASDLDQVGDVLEHGRAAVMVTPGDADSLVDGIAALIDDPARAQALGREARRLALLRHTWHAHTARIIERLTERFGAE
jgi:glycosyltransferase involved in cell wall biosynthesis